MDRTAKYLRRDPSHIKEDMRRTAELLWGVESVSPDRLDPVIHLLFGAFAQEVFAVQQDVMEHKKRLLEMAVQALLPAELTMPYPAHAVLHGRPLDAQTWTHRTRTTLSASHAMDVHDRVGKNFSFTPSDEFRLHVGGIKYVLLADKLYGPDVRTGMRRTLATAEGAPLHALDVWLGLELKEPVDPVAGLPLFFTLPPGDPDEPGLLTHLPRCTFHIGEEVCTTVPGIRPRKERGPIFERIADPVRSLESEVLAYYQHKFITIVPPRKAPKALQVPTALPERFRALFGQEIEEEVGAELVWLRMRWPSSANGGALTRINAAINCFPAIERQLQERSAGHSGLVSLPHGEDVQFWAVDEVVDMAGRTVAHERRTANPPDRRTMTYAVRRGGMERIDEREAYERLLDLLHTVRNDHAAFAALSETELAEGLSRVREWLEEYRNRHKRPPFPPTYLLFSEPPAGNVHVDYWTTNGAMAHRIPAYKGLRLDAGAYLGDARTMTVPCAGEDTPRSASLGERLRGVLGDGGQAMPTMHAVRTICLSAIPDHLQHRVELEIGRKIQLGPGEGDGFQRTLAVLLRVTGGDDAEDRQWNGVVEHVRNVLSRRMQGLLPVHVRYETAA
ncbi:MAG: type VI secretion system baseplate subunit TssF [Flavobacteriales bacterium]|nr:type VI secretion system baseplate subunit TssF [Flavobacteriales bacterium]